MSDIEETLEEIQGLLAWHVRQRIGDQESLVDDAVQEAMIAAWMRLEEGKPTGIAVHNGKQAVVDLLRGGRMTGSKRTSVPLGAHARAISLTIPTRDDGEEYTIEPADARAADAFDEVDSEDALQRLLAALSDDQRSLVLSRLAGLTTREIAETEGVSHQAISLRIKRIRERLDL